MDRNVLRRRVSCFAVVCIGLLPLRAQAQGSSSITWGNGYPTYNKNAQQIQYQGKYTLDTGWTADKVTVQAIAGGGGTGGSNLGGLDGCKKTWVGAITGLPKGNYMVFAQLQLSGPMGQLAFINSPVKPIMIP